MNLHHVGLIFRKDAVEILRDRRTLFVNVVLPVLLYPLLALFMLQVTQLSRLSPREPAGVVALGLPDDVLDDLDPGHQEPPRRGRPAASGDAPPPVLRLVQVAPTAEAALLALLHAQLRHEDAEAARLAGSRSGSAPDPALATARAATLRWLRAHGTAAVVWNAPPEGERRRVVVVRDDAHPRTSDLQPPVRRAVEAWRKRLVEASALAVNLPLTALEPVSTATWSCAPTVESLRTGLAAILPMLLVLMAASGAFFPAVDLIAGERERGTLETLLTWPADRRDLFLGKLLVACAAAAVTVGLNLLSLGGSAALIAGNLGGAVAAPFSGVWSVGAGVLVLAFVVLLPITVALAAIALGATGLAASTKEAQNYLTPLVLVVVVAAVPCLIPDTRPSVVLDLIPITGAALVLKEGMLGNLSWLHLALATASSAILATVVVAWAARLFDRESFRYPAMARSGWGRFRRGRASGLGGPESAGPDGLEALGIFAVGAGLFLGVSTLLTQAHPVLALIVPLTCGIALPALGFAWLGGWDRRIALHARRPDGRVLLAAALAGILAGAASVAIGLGQQGWFPPMDKAFEEKFLALQQQAGPLVFFLCVTVVPGVCEEILFRGVILAGLRRSLGDATAVLITAFLFAALHLSPERFLAQFLVGLLLGALVVRCGSIWPAILLHALHNAAALGIGTLAMQTPIPGAMLALAAFAGTVGAWTAMWSATRRR